MFCFVFKHIILTICDAENVLVRLLSSNRGHCTSLILSEVINYSLTRFTDPCALCVCSVSRWVLVDAHQPLVTLAQIVPGPSAALPLHPGADGAAAAHACRHAAFTLELQRPAGGAVDLLAGRAVEGLELLGCSRGRLLWPQRPQQGTQEEESPHHSIESMLKNTCHHLFIHTSAPLDNTPARLHSLRAATSTPHQQPIEEGRWDSLRLNTQLIIHHVLSPHYQRCDFVLKWFLLLNTVR